jgi:hypothetical protein
VADRAGYWKAIIICDHWSFIQLTLAPGLSPTGYHQGDAWHDAPTARHPRAGPPVAPGGGDTQANRDDDESSSSAGAARRRTDVSAD